MPATPAHPLTLTPGQVRLEELRPVFRGPIRLELVGEATERLARGWQVIAEAVAGDAPVYAVNTGFGRLADKRIAAACERIRRR